MSTDGNQDDLNLLRIQVAEDAKSDEQVWVYQNGLVKSRVRLCIKHSLPLVNSELKHHLHVFHKESRQCCAQCGKMLILNSF